MKLLSWLRLRPRASARSLLAMLLVGAVGAGSVAVSTLPAEAAQYGARGYGYNAAAAAARARAASSGAVTRLQATTAAQDSRIKELESQVAGLQSALTQERQRSQLAQQRMDVRLGELETGIARYTRVTTVALVLAALLVGAMGLLLLQREKTERARSGRRLSEKLRESERLQAANVAALRGDLERRVQALRDQLDARGHDATDSPPNREGSRGPLADATGTPSSIAAVAVAAASAMPAVVADADAAVADAAVADAAVADAAVADAAVAEADVADAAVADADAATAGDAAATELATSMLAVDDAPLPTVSDGAVATVADTARAEEMATAEPMLATAESLRESDADGAAAAPEGGLFADGACEPATFTRPADLQVEVVAPIDTPAANDATASALAHDPSVVAAGDVAEGAAADETVAMQEASENVDSADSAEIEVAVDTVATTNVADVVDMAATADAFAGNDASAVAAVDDAVAVTAADVDDPATAVTTAETNDVVDTASAIETVAPVEASAVADVDAVVETVAAVEASEVAEVDAPVETVAAVEAADDVGDAIEAVDAVAVVGPNSILEDVDSRDVATPDEPIERGESPTESVTAEVPASWSSDPMAADVVYEAPAPSDTLAAAPAVADVTSEPVAIEAQRPPLGPPLADHASVSGSAYAAVAVDAASNVADTTMEIAGDEPALILGAAEPSPELDFSEESAQSATPDEHRIEAPIGDSYFDVARQAVRTAANETESFDLGLDATLPPERASAVGPVGLGDRLVPDRAMASDVDAALRTEVSASQLGRSLHDTLDPEPLEPTRPPEQPLFGVPDARVNARLAALELRDDLRQHLHQSPELLRALVQQALAVLLKPEPRRSGADWRLLVLDAWRRGNYEEALARTEAMSRTATSDVERLDAGLQRGLVLEKLKQPTQAIAAFEAVVAASGHADEAIGSKLVATAMLHRGLIQRRELQDVDAARASLTALVTRYGEHRDDALAPLLVRGLTNLALVESAPGGDISRALALYERVRRDFGDSGNRQVETSVAQAHFNRAVLLYERANDVDGAVSAYRDLIDRFVARQETEIALLVANALANLGWLLARKCGDVQGAIGSYRELDRRYGEHRDRDIAKLVARSLFAAASLTSSELKLPPAAVTLYADLVRRYELFDDADFAILIAKSLFNIGAIHAAQAGCENDALAAYDSLVQRFESRDGPLFGEWVAGALVNRAGLLARRADTPQALETYWQVVRDYGNRLEPGIAEQVVKALLNVGALLSQQGDVDGAIAAYQEIGRRYAAVDDMGVFVVVTRALSNLASLFANVRQDVEAALRTFGELVARIGTRGEPELAEQGARALFGMGVLLAGARKDPDGAVATYELLVQRYGERSEPAIVQQVVKGLFNQAALQAREQRDLRAALYTLDVLLTRFGDRDEPGVAERIVSGMVNKARIERMLGHRDRAQATFEAVLERFERSSEPEIHKHVEAARRALGEGLVA